MAEEQPSMHGKVCLITGATAGIGLVTAEALARQGATVVAVARHAERGAALVERLRQTTGKQAVELLLADLSSQEQIRRLAQAFRQRFARLDVLVNNAGAIFTKRQCSVDHIEMTLALNHLGYFLLTHLLLDTLQASAPARIINVASDAHRNAHIDFDDLQGERRYSGWRAYCQSKLANILFTYALATRLHGSGVTVNALHPGFVATNFGNNNGGLFGWLIRLFKIGAISPERGAQTMIYLATAPAVAGHTGAYFVRKRPVRSSSVSYHQEDAERLWQLSAAMTGVS